MKRLNILYVTHRFPYPPKRGGKIRPFNVISHLNQTHKITVASLVRSEEEAREGEGLRDHCSKIIARPITAPAAAMRMLGRLPTTIPSSMGNFYAPRLARDIKQELNEQKFDFIFVHCSSVAQYVENVKGITKMLDFGDMDSQKWLDYAKIKRFPLNAGYWLEGVKLERAEKLLAEKFDYCLCTTKAEKETLDSYNCNTNTAWYPNGVDHEHFQPSTDPYDPDQICFIGRMDYFPNQECMFDFCNNTLALIRRRRPKVKLTIIGADPSIAVKKLEQIEGVTVTGSVPDVRPYVLKSAVNVAPLNIARGTQNKILESLAMGVPVVSSVIAAGGIDAVPNEHFLVASNPQQYADAIVRLLEDREERARLSVSGRERVLSNHSWSNSMLRLDDIIEKCINQRNEAVNRGLLSGSR